MGNAMTSEAVFCVRVAKLLPFQGACARLPFIPGCRFACPGLFSFALSGRDVEIKTELGMLRNAL